MEPATLREIVFRSFDRFNRADHYGFKRDGRWLTLSTWEARERVRQLAGALTRAGIGRGDRVAIVSPTRLEWALVDYAALALGAVVVPVYPTLPPAQTAHILSHSGARIAFIAGRDEWSKLEAVRRDLPDLKEVVSFEPVAAERDAPRAFDDFLAHAGPYPQEGPFPDDLASIIYTSGTTGEPKGVMLTHRNIVSNVLACTEACPFEPSDVHLSFLPLCHIFERMVHYYMLWNGLTVCFAEEIAKVKENLLEVRPTVLTSVPRVLEKVLEGVEEKARPGPGLKPRITRFAIDTARAWARARHGPSADVPAWLTLKLVVADGLVLGKVREALGGRVRFVITGGAATSDAVTEFFTGAGVRVLPGYGLTETSPVVAFNTPRHFRLGTVGKPIPGVEVRIAEDGEILARGPNVMLGYYRNEAETRKLLTPERWLHTGDIGALDADGFLRITDRKKDLIATAGGKKIPPQPIEQALGEDPFIAQAVLLGEGRPYLVALVVPRFPALEEWARGRALPAGDRRALLEHPDVLALYRERIDARTANLARFETVKRFALLPRELTEASGELTPTLKVKRRVVTERYRDAIESLYK